MQDEKENEKFHPNRTFDCCCHNRSPGGNAITSSTAGKGKGKADSMHQSNETDWPGDDDVC